MLDAKKSIKRDFIFSGSVIGCSLFKCKNCLLTRESVATVTGRGKAKVLLVPGNLTRGSWSCWWRKTISTIAWVSWSRTWTELGLIGLVVRVEVEGGRFGVEFKTFKMESNKLDNSCDEAPSVTIPYKGESHLFWLLGTSNLKIKSSNWSTGYALSPLASFHCLQVSSRTWQWITKWGVAVARAWQ